MRRFLGIFFQRFFGALSIEGKGIRGGGEELRSEGWPLRSSPAAEIKVERADSNRDTGMLISPAEPPNPPEERSEHQQAATNQSERNRSCNRGATDVLLDHAERRQGVPKRGPD